MAEWNAEILTGVRQETARCSVVIVFDLAPHCQDVHGLRILYFVERYVATASKLDHQFAQERALACFAKNESGSAQVAFDFLGDGVDGTLCQVKVFGCARAVQQKIEEP